MNSPTVIHEAQTDQDTGRTAFRFQHGQHFLCGQVPSVAEYQNLCLVFQAWAQVELPEPFELPADVWEADPVAK